ncbi:MAG: hypothetical protein AAGA95_14645, partial [Pseudomonadota bacterium]
GNVQTEAGTPLDDLLDARTGDIFGMFAGLFRGEDFVFSAALFDPAFRQDPTAYKFVRLDSLRKSDIVVPMTAEVLEGSELFPVENLINGSGLDAEQFGRHQGREFENWVTDAAFPDYFSAGLPAPVLLFDLGEDVELNGMLLWNYTFGSTDGNPQGNAAQDIRLQFATDAQGASGINEDPAFAEDLRAGPPEPGLQPNNFRERHPFSRPVTARYVRMTILSNYADAEGFSGGDRVGLGELAFFTFDDRIFSDSFETD